jgi:hypothetical protein
VGRGSDRDFARYHAVLNRARWSALAVSRVLPGLLIDRKTMRRDQKPILTKPYDVQTLAERFARAYAPRRITLTPETAQAVSRALQFFADVLANPRDEANFTVDVWCTEGGIFDTMARASGAKVARAAFDHACSERLGYRVTLRQGIRVVSVREAAAGRAEPAA